MHTKTDARKARSTVAIGTSRKLSTPPSNASSLEPTTQRFIDGLTETIGLKVVIIDDVCTTGDSTVKAIERARLAGMEVLAAMCLVDRGGGAGESIQEKFSIPLHAIFTLVEMEAG